MVLHANERELIAEVAVWMTLAFGVSTRPVARIPLIVDGDFIYVAVCLHAA